jgi:hypothetical protein
MKLVITSYASITRIKSITMKPGRHHHIPHTTRNTETNIVTKGQNTYTYIYINLAKITGIIKVLTININTDPYCHVCGVRVTDNNGF